MSPLPEGQLEGYDAPSSAWSNHEAAAVHWLARWRRGELAAYGPRSLRELPRRIALLLPARPTDPEFQEHVGAFLQGLQQAGWVIGRNVQLEYRWTDGNPDNTRKYIAELVSLARSLAVLKVAVVRAPLLSVNTILLAGRSSSPLESMN